MICHQRKMLPNTRLINKAEARAITYQKLKNQKVNWCAFAEWTCRNEIRRKDTKDDVQEVAPTPPSGIPRDGVRQDRLTCTSSQKPSINFGELTKTMPESNNRRMGTDCRENKSVGEWQEYVLGLERVLPSSEEVVRNLERRKEELAMEKVRVISQVDFGALMVKTAEDRLKELQGSLEEQQMRLSGLCTYEDTSEKELLQVESEGMQLLQCQIDLQKKVIESLTVTSMSGPGASDRSLILLQHDQAMELWENATRRLGVWKIHKDALQAQLRQLRLGFQRPGFFPAPMPFVILDPTEGRVPTTTIDFNECPFCLRGFEPAWDCKVASCKHGYHSWCAWTHFSNCSTCYLKDCGMEMHPEWWVLSGIPKPQENAAIEGAVWSTDERLANADGLEGTPFNPRVI